MENEMENLLRKEMSVDALQIAAPDISLVSAARKKIGLRKKPISKWQIFSDQVMNLIFLQKKAYHLILTMFVIAGCFFYFSKPVDASLKISKNNNYTGKTGSITSSTILATNNEHWQKKPSVNTPTAMASIVTFITIN